VTDPAAPSALAEPSSSGPSAPLEVLQRVFGYDAFRGDQAAIIDQVVGGGDALVLMPTGGGKSLRPSSGPARASSSRPSSR
jgi:ATP-dependent DNA helicase RecQ